MKKIISLFLAVVLAAGLLAACAAEPEQSAEQSDKLQIVTTIFPIYDWVRSILGGKLVDADVTMLLDSGVDLHSYQPTTEDLLTVGSCDLFIYVGGESDEWVDDALKTAANKDMVTINLLDALGSAKKEEETVEGMQAEEDEDEGDEPEYDEHVWLSLKNAAALVRQLADALSALDDANADTYQANAETYIAQLETLDGQYQATVSAADQDTILFGDRFPFRYLADDYGLNYFAAFSGCSVETEASFETVLFLAQKVDELELPAVLTIEGSDQKIAETIVQSTNAKNQQILTLDSMQSVTSQDVLDGANYLAIMRANLSVLAQALGQSAPAGPAGDASVDVDLTVLSSTMVYSEVYNMLMNPEEYIGRTVKMEGACATYHDDSSGADYYACIIQDATACCAQGIEFVLTDGSAYPSPDTEISVVGVFDTYDEDGRLYCTLRDAHLV